MQMVAAGQMGGVVTGTQLLTSVSQPQTITPSWQMTQKSGQTHSGEVCGAGLPTVAPKRVVEIATKVSIEKRILIL
jgi:hypothetical protein